MGRKEDNLIPGGHKLTVEEQSKGGRASANARKKKKSAREAARFHAYELPLPKPLAENLREQGLDVEELNHLNASIRSMFARAEQGDVNAFKALITLMGEWPAESIDADVDIKMGIEYIESGHGLAYSEDEVDESQ